MSGTIFTVVILIIGALIFGAGLYYLVREKNDLESKKIYSVITLVGALMVIGTILKLVVAGL